MATFGSRDLALLLPDEVGDIFSLRHTATGEITDTHEPLKPKIDQTKKITRYFPGKTPTWAVEESNNEELVEAFIDRRAGKIEDEDGNYKDSRLSRLSSTVSSRTTSRRRIYEAEVIADESDEDNEYKHLEEEDENVLAEKAEALKEEENYEIAARRARILQKKKREETELILNKKEDSDVSEESESSEYETDTDDSSEEEDKHKLLKPIFVPKNKRETISESEALHLEEEAKQKKKIAEIEERKKQTRVLLAESIRREAERVEVEVTDNDSDSGLPDDTDDLDDEKEYEDWKLREMARLKRDAEQREKQALEVAELTRRRNMSEADRLAEDRRLGRFDPKEKAKWKFMQKYYHKGVFYLDEDTLAKDETDVRKKEYNEPTLEDKFDREKLPSVMQVKNFGKRGRTKYTHLLDQDTTKFDQTSLRPDEQIKENYMSKRSGVGDIDGAGRRTKIQKVF